MAPVSEPSAAAPRVSGGLLLAALLLIAAVFARGLGGGFVWDDRYLILDDPRVQDRHQVGDVLTAPFAHGDRAGRLQAYYRPLVTLSYFADFQVWGPEPFGFHLSNLLLHLAVCLLLWLLLRALLPAPALAAGLTLWFGLHPAHVPSVVWIAGRVDLLGGALILLALWLWVQVRIGAQPAALRWLSLPVLALALAAKEIAFVYSVLVVALDLHLRSRRPGDRAGLDWRYHAGAGAVCAGFLVWRQHVLAGVASPSLHGLGQRLPEVLAVSAHYLRVLFVPFGLHGYDFSTSLVEGRVGALATTAVVVAALGLAAWRRWTLAWLGGAWLVVLLLPVVGIVEFDAGAAYLAADHRAYLPSMGGALVLAGLLQPLGAWASRSPAARRLAALLASLLLVASAVEIQRTTGTWRDENTLFSTLARRTPGDATFMLQGFAALERGEAPAAEQAFRAGVAAAPDNWMQHFGLGQALLLRGDHAGALLALQRAAEFEGAFSDVFNDLGNLHLLAHDLPAACAAYERALTLAPGNYHAMFNLAQACLEVGERARAEPWLRRFVHEAPAAYRAQKEQARAQLAGH